MKIHKWEEVIKYFLDKHYNSYLWNYVTALRSGDDTHDVWKFMITTMIRGEGLDSIAWDISWSKDCLREYEDETISYKMSNNFKMTPSHYISHSQRGLESLAIYYRDVIKNDNVADLLKQLSSKIADDRIEIPKIVRRIINILYENNSKNEN